MTSSDITIPLSSDISSRKDLKRIMYRLRLPRFLYQDIKNFLASLNSYKREHLLVNKLLFIDYVKQLRKHYRSLCKIHAETQSQLVIQSLFILSCTEFSSGSKERLHITHHINDKLDA